MGSKHPARTSSFKREDARAGERHGPCSVASAGDDRRGAHAKRMSVNVRADATDANSMGRAVEPNG